MRKLRHVRVLITGVIGLLCIMALTPVGASSANISHSYHSDGPITDGSIVSLDPSRTDYILPANSDNGARIFGVAVASNDSLLAVDPTAGDIQVATSGNANTLVSTLNGNIHVGDQVAVSPFSGIGMKALPGSHVIGLAQTAFNAGSDGAATRTVTDKDGRQTSINVGYVRLTIGIGTTAAAGGTDQGLSALQRFAKSLTGHVISTPRIILALVVALVAVIALMTLIYASIYGSIISVGRNPLARSAIFRTLGSVLAMAGVTAILAGSLIFFLLH
jgi:hypothetical protein